MVRKTSLVAIAFALGVSGAASAQSMKVKPGLWESTVVMTGPMSSTRTDTECFTDGELKPEDVMGEETAMCAPTNVKVTDNSMSFNLSCTEQGMTITGDVEYETTGDRGTGKIDMTMSGAGMNMSASVDMTAKWLGPC